MLTIASGPGMRALGSALGLVLVAASLGSAEPGPAEAYQLHCSGCHGVDGRGDERIIPSLHGLAPLLSAPGGREYLARVPGVAQAPLPSAELAVLLNWVLQTFSGATGIEPYRAQEIEVLRRRPLRDPVAARPRISNP